MIIVSNIEPVDLASKYRKVSDLESDYLFKFTTGYKPRESLVEAIRKKRRTKNSIKKTIFMSTNSKKTRDC